MDRTVRITVIGDAGVGKTSLITSAATECFSEVPPPVLPPTRLPPESTPEAVPILITDTSSRPEDRPALELAVTSAQVVVLAFDITRPDTLDRCGNYWMRELRRLGVNAPVVLVGCKSDVKSLDSEVHKTVIGTVSSHKQIEICMECSAKSLQFVGEVFYYALKAVVNPIGPLFDTETATLKPLCVRALKRVFNMCDRDKDKVLNDAELNSFQVRCFNAPLAPDELKGVKDVVAEKLPQGVTSDGGLTFHGFLFLHALFIERGRTETPWAVLRQFGYDNFLKLSDELLDQVAFKHAPDQVVELTEAGLAFFTSAFVRFDSNQDGLLSKADLEDMFSTAPCSPWCGRQYDRLLVETGSGGSLTLDGFLGKWVYTTAVEPRKALAYCHYLGLEGDPAALFSVSRPRRQERRGDPQSRRGTYMCYVFGPPNAGKTSLLAGLAGAATGSAAANTPRDGCHAAVGRVDCSGNGGSGSGSAPDGGSPCPSSSSSSSCWLIMREFDDAAASKLLGSSSSSPEEAAEQLAPADVAAFVFDSSDTESFRLSAQLMEAVGMASGDALPCAFVASKDDLGMSQELANEAGEVCGQLKLRMPVAVSMRLGETGRVYQQLTEAALCPGNCIPETPSLKATRRYRKILRRVLLYTAAGTITASTAYALYHMYYQGSSRQRASADAAGGGSSSNASAAGGAASSGSGSSS